MNEVNKFKQNLIEKDSPPENIDEMISTLTEFQEFLDKRGKTFQGASSEDFYDFSNILIGEEKNTRLAYIAILSLGDFFNYQNLSIFGRDVLDGSEMMVNLSKRLTKEFSKEFRDEIFKDIGIPPLGISPKVKPDYTKKLINRFVNKVGEETAEKFLAKGLRDPYTEWRKPDRERFLKSKNIDEFLAKKRERQIASLEKYRDEKSLYFTQRINDEVVEYVKNNPQIEGGIREGKTLYVTKIPHETIDYLNATDEKMKAYHFCHSPWAKEAIKDGTIDQIPTVICQCSGGYYKDYWEIVLEEPIEVKLLQSVILGDPVCQFAVTLPNDVVKDLE